MPAPDGEATVDQEVPPFVDSWTTAPVVNAADADAQVRTMFDPTRFATRLVGAVIDATPTQPVGDVFVSFDQSMFERGPLPAYTR